MAGQKSEPDPGGTKGTTFGPKPVPGGFSGVSFQQAGCLSATHADWYKAPRGPWHKSSERVGLLCPACGSKDVLPQCEGNDGIDVDINKE